jgi:hypothetical protein
MSNRQLDCGLSGWTGFALDMSAGQLSARGRPAIGETGEAGGGDAGGKTGTAAVGGPTADQALAIAADDFQLIHTGSGVGVEGGDAL